MKKLNLNKIKHVFAGGGAILTNQKHVLITILIFIELLLITCAYISYGNKNLDKYIFGKSETAKSSSFAFMLENDNGDYVLSKDNTFPGDLYTYNQVKSGCMDADGEMIENSLLFDSTKQQITITITKTTKCYLYFDRLKEEPTFSEELIKTGDLWDSKLEGDGYRYIGSGTVGSSTNPNNFVCFGTTDKDTCTANPSTYMYRIIGIFKLNDNSYYAKLIKYKQLSSTYTWHSSRTTDTAWGSSAMYTGLNGSYFLTNTTYSYMQDTTWTNRIADWTWTTVNTLTSSSSGPNYYNGLSPSNIYLHEMNKDSKTSTVGTWTTTSAKIGLMYASDFALSLGDSALALTTGTYANRTTLLTGWIHQNKNGYSNNEWLIDRYGKSGSYYYAYYLNSAGYVTNSYAYNSYYVRPVFYLKNDTRKTSGTGSSTDPYILDVTDKLYVNLSNSGSTLTATITKGTGNLNKYCINTSSSITNCTWNNITSTSITYTMPDYGTYYVHVIDDAGYIAHSSITHSPGPLATTLINSGNLWQSGLKDDGYRFTGSGAVSETTNPNNFVCFGTADRDTCIFSLDLYMYRIIGVFEDENGDNHVKLIKYTQLGAYAWNADDSTDTDWADSDLYKGLNGSYFLTNTTYSYMQDSIWLNKIANWKWSAANTKTWDDYTNNPTYSQAPGKGIYLHEMNKGSSSDTSCINFWETAINCLGGSWSKPIAKSGVMYVSDFALSLGAAAPSYISESNSSILITSWIHQSNNDTSASSYEWTISRIGSSNSISIAWNLQANGSLNGECVAGAYGVRPVFYLTSDVKSLSGTGTWDDPYMLDVS